MGCNYYLRKKCKYDENIYDENISRIKNGIIFKDYFYPTVYALNDNYYRELHIGKSSCGWHFLLCAYKDKNINTLEDWVREFNDPNTEIYNECDEKITPEEMLDTITNRRSRRYVDNETETQRLEREAIELKEANEMNDIFGHRKFGSFDDYLDSNHCKRGMNGLWSHIYSEPTGGTYDITYDTDFS